MRLIDANALYEKIEDHVTTVSVCPTVDWARGKSQFKQTCLEDIENAPTIDAAPVVHGRWIRQKGSAHVFKCSACGFVFAGAAIAKYCPNCGAKMDDLSPKCGPDYCEIGGGDDES